MTDGSLDGGRSVASRIAAILMAFRSGSTHSLTQLAQLTGLPMSTTHRLVGELTSRRVLERTAAGDYRIGLPLRMIAPAGQPDRPVLLAHATPVMQDLAASMRTPVRLGVLDGPRLDVAEALPEPGPAPHFTAAALPTYATALGRALLAFSPAALVEEVLAVGLAADRPHPPLTPDRLRRALAVTRLTRVAVTRLGRETSRCAIAVPVFGTGGAVLAALELEVPDLRSGLDRARSALAVGAGSLSRELATATSASGEPAGSPEEPDSAAG